MKKYRIAWKHKGKLHRSYDKSDQDKVYYEDGTYIKKEVAEQIATNLDISWPNLTHWIEEAPNDPRD